MFPIALVLVIIIIAVTAFVSLTRAIFFSETTTKVSTSEIDNSATTLASTNADASVKMTVRGPIVADEKFKTYQVLISPSNRNISSYNGYLGEKTSEINLGNNIPAYEQFIYALGKANLAKGIALAGDSNDIRGVCATGNVYVFDIIKADKSVKNLWTSTCKGSPGSLDASVAQLHSLFVSQIPGATDLIDKTNI